MEASQETNDPECPPESSAVADSAADPDTTATLPKMHAFHHCVSLSEYDADDTMTLDLNQEGEYWLCLDASDPSEVGRPSILSRKERATKTTRNDCNLCIDMDGPILTVKDMREEDKDKDSIEFCIARRGQSTLFASSLEDLPRRQLRVLHHGDRLCILKDQVVQQVLEHRYEVAICTKTTEVEASKINADDDSQMQQGTTLSPAATAERMESQVEVSTQLEQEAVVMEQQQQASAESVPMAPPLLTTQPPMEDNDDDDEDAAMAQENEDDESTVDPDQDDSHPASAHSPVPAKDAAVGPEQDAAVDPPEVVATTKPDLDKDETNRVQPQTPAEAEDTNEAMEDPMSMLTLSGETQRVFALQPAVAATPASKAATEASVSPLESESLLPSPKRLAMNTSTLATVKETNDANDAAISELSGDNKAEATDVSMPGASAENVEVPIDPITKQNVPNEPPRDNATSSGAAQKDVETKHDEPDADRDDDADSVTETGSVVAPQETTNVDEEKASAKDVVDTAQAAGPVKDNNDESGTKSKDENDDDESHTAQVPPKPDAKPENVSTKTDNVVEEDMTDNKVDETANKFVPKEENDVIEEENEATTNEHAEDDHHNVAADTTTESNDTGKDGPPEEPPSVDQRGDVTDKTDDEAVSEPPASVPRSTRRKRTRHSPTQAVQEAHSLRSAKKRMKRAVDDDVIRIIFTGISTGATSAKDKKMVQKIGGTVLDEVDESLLTATHVIARQGKNTIRRTPKLMIGICRTPNIVGYEWLVDSSKKGKPLPCSKYLITDDKEAESKYEFSMRRTTKRTTDSLKEDTSLLEGWSVFVCRGVAGHKAPAANELELIIKAAGGSWLSSLSSLDGSDYSRVLIITNDPATKKQTTVKAVASALDKGARAMTTTELFNSIMRQELEE